MDMPDKQTTPPPSPITKNINTDISTNNQFANSFPIISKGLEDSYLLVQHATMRGIEVDNSILLAIISSREAFEQKKWTPEIEISFWNAFRKLSQATIPATVESLRAVDPLFGEKIKKYKLFGPLLSFSYSESAMQFFKKRALICMLLLLIFQIFWVLGNNISNNLLEIDKQISDSGNKENQTKTDAFISARIAQLQYMQKMILYPEVFLPEDPGSSNDLRNSYLEIMAPKAFAAQLNIIALFILPILYGYLGACTYIVRKLSYDIAQFSFSKELFLQYKLRLLLGILSGLSVAWFIRVDPGDKITSDHINAITYVEAVSPWALSFLAGYSVELLFTALDRIVMAFSGKQDNIKQSSN